MAFKKLRWVASALTIVGFSAVASWANETGSPNAARHSDEPPVVLARAKAVAGLENRTIQVGSDTREYHLYVPDGARGQSSPLVIVFHGGGGNALPFAGRIGVQDMADRYGYVIAMPEGLQESWNTGSIDPQGYSEMNGIDDVGFVSALIDDLVGSGIADASRVYAMGMSRGGMMVYTVACDLPGRFAAIASVSGTLSSGKCPNATGTSLLHIHGTNDQNVPFDGGHGASAPPGQSWASARDGIAIFAGTEQCSANWQTSQTTSDTLCQRTTCAGAVEVEYCLIEGGGHTWPGGQMTKRQKNKKVTSSASFDATDYIAQFFQRH